MTHSSLYFWLLFSITCGFIVIPRLVPADPLERVFLSHRREACSCGRGRLIRGCPFCFYSLALMDGRRRTKRRDVREDTPPRDCSDYLALLALPLSHSSECCRRGDVVKRSSPFQSACQSARRAIAQVKRSADINGPFPHFPISQHG